MCILSREAQDTLRNCFLPPGQFRVIIVGSGGKSYRELPIATDPTRN